MTADLTPAQVSQLRDSLAYWKGLAAERGARLDAVEELATTWHQHGGLSGRLCAADLRAALEVKP